jgi:hypothetical protein
MNSSPQHDQPVCDIAPAMPQSGRAQPPAMFFQRQAGAWLDLAREHAVRSGVLPMSIGRAKLELLEVVRSELLVRLGAELAAMNRQQATAASTSDATRTDPQAIRRPSPIGWNSLHNHAYQIKRNILRRFAGRAPNSSQAGDPPTILVVVRTQSHASDLVAIANNLRSDFQLPVAFAVTEGKVGRRIEAAGFPAYNLFARPDRSGRLLIRSQSAELRRVCQSLDNFTPDQELFSPRQTARLIATTTSLLHERIADALRQAWTITQLLERLRPQVVLAGNPYTVEGKIAVLAARDYGVASAAVEHGTIFANDPRWDRSPLDLVCVWGDPSRRALESNGLAPDRIAITGSPRHDAIFLGAAAARAEARDSDTANILVATSGPGDQVGMIEHQGFIELLTAAIEQLPSVRWVIKLHPKDRPEYYGSLGAMAPERVRIVRGKPESNGADIFEFLKTSRALVTVTSSTALDAMSVGVPVIAVDVWPAGQRPSGIFFLQRGCARPAATAEELAAQVRGAWDFEPQPDCDNAARQYVAEQFANQGTAVGAVTRELVGLVASHRQESADSPARHVSRSI